MVDPDLYSAYSTAVTASADLLERAVTMLMEGLASSGATLDEAEARLKELLPALKDACGDYAAQAAVEFYRAQRRRSGVEGDYEPTMGENVPDSFVADDVTAAADVQRKSGAFDSAKMAAHIAGKMKRYPAVAAEYTIIDNAQRDPAHPRWAFVPSMGACPWCCMVGSNGFNYRSEASAKAQRHANCTCAVVADFDTANPHLDGYDPDGMRDRLMQCAGALDSGDWSDALKEARTRDREWVRTGRPVPIDYTEKHRGAYGILSDDASDYRASSFIDRFNEWKDLFAHDVLSANGFSVVAHETVLNGGYTNIDVDLNGQLCEIKSPNASHNPESKDELKFVRRNLQTARHQFRDDGAEDMRIVLSNYYTGFDGEDEERVFERFCREIDLQGFVEGLFIMKDGTIRRAK